MVQVNQNVPITVRVKFSKVGSLQYISHLDLVRTMAKIVVRSRLPLWYTEGFNPKPKLTFSAPISIGTQSVCEFLDIRLTERVDPQLVMDSLNRNMAPEMQVIEAYYPETKLTALKYLAYEICMHTRGADADLAARCLAKLNAPEILVEKKTKSGPATVNIRPLIKQAELTLEDGALMLRCVLSSTGEAFLNPEHLIRYLRAECGILSSYHLLEEYYSVMRTAAFYEDMRPFR